MRSAKYRANWTWVTTPRPCVSIALKSGRDMNRVRSHAAATLSNSFTRRPSLKSGLVRACVRGWERGGRASEPDIGQRSATTDGWGAHQRGPRPPTYQHCAAMLQLSLGRLDGDLGEVKLRDGGRLCSDRPRHASCGRWFGRENLAFAFSCDAALFIVLLVVLARPSERGGSRI